MRVTEVACWRGCFQQLVRDQLTLTETARLAEQAKAGLRMVAEGENRTMAGWLVYGNALNEGRALFPSDEKFGQWVCNNLAHTERHDRAAAMWATVSSKLELTRRKEHILT